MPRRSLPSGLCRSPFRGPSTAGSCFTDDSANCRCARCSRRPSTTPKTASGMTQVIGHYWALNFPPIRKAARRREVARRTRQRQEDVSRRRARSGRGRGIQEPDLARTYRQIAEGGRAAFYEGAIAQDDRRVHRPHRRRPDRQRPCRAQGRVGRTGHRLGTAATPSRSFPPTPRGSRRFRCCRCWRGSTSPSMGHNSADALHLMVEAKRLAFEPCALLRRPRHGESAHRATRRRGIRRATRKADRPEARPPSVTAGAPALENGDTTYLTVADSSGMMISLIQSNYRGMGSVWCQTASVSCFRTAASSSLWNRDIRTFTPRQSGFSHDHPRLRPQRRKALAQLRSHGRRNAAAGPCADPHQHDRLRDERPRGRRRRALSP